MVKKKMMVGNNDKKKLKEKAEALNPIDPLEIPAQKKPVTSYKGTPSHPNTTKCFDQLTNFRIKLIWPSPFITLCLNVLIGF